MSARLLFGEPGGFGERHGAALIAGVLLLIALAEWLSDVAGAAVASLP